MKAYEKADMELFFLSALRSGLAVSYRNDPRAHGQKLSCVSWEQSTQKHHMTGLLLREAISGCCEKIEGSFFSNLAASKLKYFIIMFVR